MMDLSNRIRPLEVKLPVIYFDGANVEGNCGCGAWIRLYNMDYYHIVWNGGLGTKNKSQIIAAWNGIMVVYFQKLPYIHVYGDSKYAVDGICGRMSISFYDRS